MSNYYYNQKNEKMIHPTLTIIVITQVKDHLLKRIKYRFLEKSSGNYQISLIGRKIVIPYAVQ